MMYRCYGGSLLGCHKHHSRQKAVTVTTNSCAYSHSYQIKADLKTVKYDMTDDMFATALLHGLPPSYRTFKEKYDWIRSTKPDDPPDLDYLYERLHVEEAQQLRMKE